MPRILYFVYQRPALITAVTRQYFVSQSQGAAFACSVLAEGGETTVEEAPVEGSGEFEGQGWAIPA